jgi:hypothetical protein
MPLPRRRACCKQDDTFVAEDVNSECCFLFREFGIAMRGCAATTMRDRDLRAAACVAGMLPQPQSHRLSLHLDGIFKGGRCTVLFRLRAH